MSEWEIHDDGSRTREWDFQNPDGTFKPEEIKEFHEWFNNHEKFRDDFEEYRTNFLKEFLFNNIRECINLENELTKLSKDLEGLVRDNTSGKNIQKGIELADKGIAGLIILVKSIIKFT